MRVLLLAPHPFYIDRGTPIDVLLVLRVLAERVNVQVDVVAYHEGHDVDLPNTRIHRIAALPFLGNVRPGFSLKKLLCDVLFFFRAWGLVRANRYDFVHAGEEAVFFAMFFRWLYRIPYAYDIDSSIAQQLVEKRPAFTPFASLFDRFERAAMRRSLINFPVCNALGDLCRRNSDTKYVVLHDISQLKDPDSGDPARLRHETGLSDTIFLYSGNLEAYQGIDLLLESFAVALQKEPELGLVVVGGHQEDVDQYRRRARELGIDRKTIFTGARPFADLVDYLAGADVLVCPRIRGINTPMKVFPYLHSGKPVLVTDLPTHSQVLTPKVAFLAPAHPDGFADGMLMLARNAELRNRLGAAGRAFAEESHTYKAHQRRLHGAYDWIEAQLEKSARMHPSAVVERA